MANRAEQLIHKGGSPQAVDTKHTMYMYMFAYKNTMYMFAFKVY